MDPRIDDIIEREAAAASVVLDRWIPRSAVVRHVRRWINAVVRDDPDRSPADRLTDVVQWRPGATALVRFAPTADSRPYPHVAIVARSESPPSSDDLALLAETARARFADRHPEAICVFAYGAVYQDWLAGTVPYKRVLARPVAELRLQPAPPGAERVTVRTPSNLDFFPEYEAMYEAFRRTSPDLRDVIGIERREDLEAYLASDGLRLVLVDDELGGLVAGLRHAEFGMAGWRMRERVMAERHRGTGLGAAALWAFIRDLAASPDDLLWGTILMEHHASMRSARRLGREDMGGWHWVPITRPPPSA